MRTPITYYGGKQRLASTIISMMPKHKIYCEPFFGGGAVYFQKPKAGIEVINDKNDMLINFYLCIQNRFEELHIRLCDTQISCRDAIRIIKERDTPETFFYLDPPYPGAFQQHYSGYTHKDLFELLQVLSQIKGKFILSNYWCQTLRWHILKFGWNYKAIEVSLKVANLGKTPVGKRTEILVFNYDIEKTLFD